MDLNVKNFLILNGVVVLALVLYFFKRRSNQPTVLRMGHGKRSSLKAGGGAVDLLKEESLKQHESAGRELNVIFVFNGHPFDAYEALGLPAGSSLDDVKAAYNASREKLDAGSREFLDKAYESIVKKAGAISRL